MADAGAELDGIPGACLADQLGQVFQLRRGLEPELLRVASVMKIGWGECFQIGLPEQWAFNKDRCMASNTIKGRRGDAAVHGKSIAASCALMILSA